ncbi:hypothetical protein FRX31_017079 [Thalictrum thalictroides]|uniref:Uncharacterized protein n=1 Tax=Thalictrum thalictroides TaxID=46969 RepID=A0A7J6W7I2_THATH|nr:hypothetical protein FRX31_017079 [Thalictrum thalictroides]
MSESSLYDQKANERWRSGLGFTKIKQMSCPTPFLFIYLSFSFSHQLSHTLPRGDEEQRREEEETCYTASFEELLDIQFFAVTLTISQNGEVYS